MPLSPMDEFLAHQTPETFDRVFTSDRNFYDRHYFNLHPCSEELFLIAGMGQYPNLGTTDAFVSIAHGDTHTVVRASRELGANRQETRVGPLGVEVIEGLRKLRIWCEPNEWGVAFDLVFDGAGPALEEPRTFQRMSHATRRWAAGRAASRWRAGPTKSHPNAGRASATIRGACDRWARPKRPASA
jgi:hypothetical protein